MKSLVFALPISLALWALIMGDPVMIPEPRKGYLDGMYVDYLNHKETSMLIRFSPMRTTASVMPTTVIKPFVGRRGGVRAYSEQRTECIEGVKASVVVAALQPAFEIAENQVDDGQEFLGHFRVSSFDHGQVFVSELRQSGIARRGVGDNHTARHDRALNEASQRQGGAIRHHVEPYATGIASTTARLRAFLREPLLYLNCANQVGVNRISIGNIDGTETRR